MVNETAEISYTECPIHPGGSVSLVDDTVILPTQEEEIQ